MLSHFQTYFYLIFPACCQEGSGEDWSRIWAGYPVGEDSLFGSEGKDGN